MANAVDAVLPQDLDLPDGYVVQWTAIDATGALVAGVVVNNVSLFGTHLPDATIDGGGTPSDWFLVPGPGS